MILTRRLAASALSPKLSPMIAASHVKGLEFYSTAAQVIPLLFIVLAFEIRFFQSHRTWQNVATFPVMFVAGFAEAIALVVLQTEKPSVVAGGVVWAGLAVVGVLIFVLLFFAAPDRT